MSAGGDIKRRQPYTNILLPYLHIYPPHCSQCPYHREYQDCQETGLSCAEELEKIIHEVGAECISAFICEPIVGSQQGAVVPPPEYFQECVEYVPNTTFS